MSEEKERLNRVIKEAENYIKLMEDVLYNKSAHTDLYCAYSRGTILMAKRILEIAKEKNVRP